MAAEQVPNTGLNPRKTNYNREVAAGQAHTGQGEGHAQDTGGKRDLSTTLTPEQRAAMQQAQACMAKHAAAARDSGGDIDLKAMNACAKGTGKTR